MSELRSLFAEQVSGVEAELVGPRLDDAGRARVARGARRGRRIQTIRTSAMATLVVAALGVGGWGLRDLLDRPDIANPPEPTNVTTPSVTPTSSATPSASVTASASPSASHDWSTVAAGDLPPAFAEADPHQPASRQMQDWVWDYVDDSWTVANYLSGTRPSPYASGPNPPTGGGTGTRVMYLLAPDSTLFHLLDVAQDLTSTSIAKDEFASIGLLWVNRFWPASRTAVVTLCYGGEMCQAARLNLVTGQVTTDFLGDAWASIMGAGHQATIGTPLEQGFVSGVDFVEHRANGVDAWTVTNVGGIRGVFWGEADGSFRASSINTVVDTTPGGDVDFQWRGLLAPSRNAALFIHDSQPWLDPGVVAPPDELYLFDLAADTTRRIDPMLPAAERCSVTRVIDDTSGVVECGPASSFTSGDTSKYRFFFSGMTAPVPYSAQVVEVEWLDGVNLPKRVLPEPKNPNPDALGWTARVSQG